MPSPQPHEFEHIEICMGTAFKFQGRSYTPHGPRISAACDTLHEADALFSTYKPDSAVARLARGETTAAAEHPLLEDIFNQCLEWQKTTDGWFSAFTPQNTFDPSGLVKAWAATRALEHLAHNETAPLTDLTLNAGGDIILGTGITNPRDYLIAIHQPVSIAAPSAPAAPAAPSAPSAYPSTPSASLLTVINLQGTPFKAVATSGTAERGPHIWNPKDALRAPANLLAQVTVIARDLITADVWATAAFAQGPSAISTLDSVPDLEALLITPDGTLIPTKNFVDLLALNDAQSQPPA